MKPTLVVLAAGMGSRYGGLKQVDPVGPSGEAILDYSVFDAHRAGFGKVVFIIRKDIEQVFREQVGSKYEGLLPVEYAFQDINDLPAPFTVPEGRTKPWGTAHAIRAARHIVHEPFAAINADDFYGRDAFAKLAEFLVQGSKFKVPGSKFQVQGGGRPEEATPYRFAMVGYKLSLTLSDHGSVARGICSLDDAGRLTKVVEHVKLVKTATGAHDDDSAAEVKDFTGDERVSMNLWGFTPELFDALETRFPEWLAANIAREKSEWYIPFVVDEMIHEGKATVDVLPTDSSWFGVTYREDKPFVTSEIRKLVDAGEYPEKLRS
ncbi:MAG: nucleotidyltransferase [bacterium]|nr:nucleotidyltransferase [bacterium]